MQQKSAATSAAIIDLNKVYVESLFRGFEKDLFKLWGYYTYRLNCLRNHDNIPGFNISSLYIIELADLVNKLADICIFISIL